MGRHRGACLGPEIVHGHPPDGAHEVEPSPDLDEAGLADELTEGPPRRFPRVLLGLAGPVEGVDYRDLARVAIEAIAYRGGERRDRREPAGNDLVEHLRA